MILTNQDLWGSCTLGQGLPCISIPPENGMVAPSTSALQTRTKVYLKEGAQCEGKIIFQWKKIHYLACMLQSHLILQKHWAFHSLRVLYLYESHVFDFSGKCIFYSFESPTEITSRIYTKRPSKLYFHKGASLWLLEPNNIFSGLHPKWKQNCDDSLFLLFLFWFQFTFNWYIILQWGWQWLKIWFYS